MPCANILFTPSYKKDGKSVYWHIRITNKITHNETPETLSHSAQSDRDLRPPRGDGERSGCAEYGVVRSGVAIRN